MSWHRITITGRVQGVGFRPYILRKAQSLGKNGLVRNKGAAVEIIIDHQDFLSMLDDLPPIAVIEDAKAETIDFRGVEGFTIAKSETSEGEAFLPPDIFMCEDCERELNDPDDRREGYYFITCTNCGPRFSMIRGVPYDRNNTSMSGFPMCQKCRKEYEAPLDRRYHAQTIGCKDCGPRLTLSVEGNDKTGATDRETVKLAARLLKEGKTLAIKGVGGFHLASAVGSVTLVRALLGREDKPFAVMVDSREAAARLVRINGKAWETLESAARPIVVLEKVDPWSLREVSELGSLGIMLPYTALHRMLLNEAGEPLIMTSCNLPGQPVALEEGMGGCVLSHERPIVNRCDDSVIRMAGDSPIFLRRSRGYAPSPVRLPFPVEDTVALGAGQGVVIACAKGRNAFLSQHIGDVSGKEGSAFLKSATETLIRFTGITPKIVACDIHPGYETTAYAQELAKKFGARLVHVQHHHAHVAAAAGEHGMADGYCGIAMDGLGFGTDGSLWGGEVFAAREDRIGHLEPHPQPGGDSAALHPRQMLFGMLAWLPDDELLEIFSSEETRVLRKMIASGFNTPLTSSAGRTLDAAAALLGVCSERTYDGRPAMLLEAIAGEPYPLEPAIQEVSGKKVLLTQTLFRFLWKNRKKERARLAATAQRYLAEGLLAIAQGTGLPIVFSGGVGGNAAISGFLSGRGVLLHKDLPPGDGCISYGQIICANAPNRTSPRQGSLPCT